ncbi:hypothetical protein NMY22_g4974 [Coprinellus aureogranulatus]|nr:hypothetical protein NMY22_g4974 [Coprinellus aureogranulatus]
MAHTTPPIDQTRMNSGRYIVLFKEEANQATVLDGIANANGLQKEPMITHQWEDLNGFAGDFDSRTLDVLHGIPEVACLAEDGLARTAAISTEQPWGVGRISSEQRLDSQSASKLIHTYEYDDRAGQGVDIYVLGTGVRVSHEEFGGRASWAGVFGRHEQADGNGHGTHVAAIAAGAKYGVAKLAHIVAIKVLSDQGSGSTSDVQVSRFLKLQRSVLTTLNCSIGGMDLVFRMHKASGRPSVLCMPLDGPPNTAMDLVSRKLAQNGIHVVVPAGNEGNDVRNTSPARVPEIITVGASTILDERAHFSNYGSAVDLFAPGVNITSAWADSDTAIKTISGTSMAAPHVAGLVAYLISVYGDAHPFLISHAVKSIASKGVLNPLTLPAGTPNLLISNRSSA